MESKKIRRVSWNVNGVRAVLKKDFYRYYLLPFNDTAMGNNILKQLPGQTF